MAWKFSKSHVARGTMVYTLLDEGASVGNRQFPKPCKHAWSTVTTGIGSRVQKNVIGVLECMVSGLRFRGQK